MMCVEDVVKNNTTRRADSIRKRLLKKETAKGKLAERKLLNAGIHVCAEGHHTG
jgi:hypothetical protein